MFWILQLKYKFLSIVWVDWVVFVEFWAVKKELFVIGISRLPSLYNGGIQKARWMEPGLRKHRNFMMRKNNVKMRFVWIYCQNILQNTYIRYHVFIKNYKTQFSKPHRIINSKQKQLIAEFVDFRHRVARPALHTSSPALDPCLSWEWCRSISAQVSQSK